MPINFSCPYCGKQTVVADQYAGQAGPCAGCGKTVSVPLSGTAVVGNEKSRSNVPIVLAIVAMLGIGGLIFVGLLAALLIPAMSTTRMAAMRVQSANNLKQIGLALHNYHSANNSFPPQYVVDAEGKPLYSWRVLILPYLEQNAFYEAWDKTKSWDSPENAGLSAAIVPVFRMPDEAGMSPETSYLAFCGPNTLFEGAKPMNFGQVTDGLSNTVIVVESRGSGVNWAEPRDLELAQLAGMNTGKPGQINGDAKRGANALYADGSVQTLPPSTPPATLQQLGDRRDGSVVTLPKK